MRRSPRLRQSCIKYFIKPTSRAERKDILIPSSPHRLSAVVSKTNNNDDNEEPTEDDAKDNGQDQEDDTNNNANQSDDEQNSDADDSIQQYTFGGMNFSTYQEMVDAKRKRNQQVLLDSGLLNAVDSWKKSNAASSSSRARPFKKQKDDKPIIQPSRKSNRLAGIEATNQYIADERGGKFTIVGDGSGAGAVNVVDGQQQQTVIAGGSGYNPYVSSEHFLGRINDGSDLSMSDAVNNIGTKLLKESSVLNAQIFLNETLKTCISAPLESTPKHLPRSNSGRQESPSSVLESFQPLKPHLTSMIDSLQVDDPNLVTKVTPDRIYSVATHPSMDKLIVCAGDKQGYVGIWDVNSASPSTAPSDIYETGVHQFRFHTGSVSCLQWTPSGSTLFSTSYDGTVRWFDVATGTFEEIFATYDDTDEFKGKLGYGIDVGNHFWTQYGCLDQRFTNEKSFFLSTSIGSAMHIDLRLPGKERITFHTQLSEKKINTLSLHPSHNYLVSAGLDGRINLWDLRKIEVPKRGNSKTAKIPDPVSYYQSPKSVTSAFVSPSGRYVVGTTMHDRLDVLHDMHLITGCITPKKHKMYSIPHDNKTGRWISTLISTFHPHLDIFCVGSMRQPRAMEIFDPIDGKCLRAVSGEVMTSVTSRCCFHPNTNQLILVGGNSSGRVTVIRS